MPQESKDPSSISREAQTTVALKGSKPPKKLLHFNLDVTSEQSIKRMTIRRKSIASKGHRVKYGLDHWTLGLFDYFFWTIFRTILLWGRRTLELRDGWDAVYQYSERDGWQTVVTKGGVGDELLVRKEGWEVVVLLNATD